MNKVTGVLSALLGAGLIASITLNVCYYRKFEADKINQIKRAAAVRRPKNKTNEQIKTTKTEVRPLIVERTGQYDANTAFIEFNTDPGELQNMTKEKISVFPNLPFKVTLDHYSYVKIHADFQPETAYRFIVRKGVENSEGRKLEYDAEFQIRFSARPTELKALSSGLVFPLKRTNRILPLEICNLDEIQVRVLHLYENNLLRFSMEPNWHGYIKALDFGKVIAEKSIPVKIPRNKEVNYGLNLNRLLPMDKTGAYGLILTAVEKKRNQKTVQLVVTVTDLAPQCVIDEKGQRVFAAVRRLSDGAACPGTQVTLVSKKFQVLGQGRTDASGLVSLDYSKAAAANDKTDFPHALLVKAGADLVFQQEIFFKGHSLAEFESDGKNQNSTEPRALVYTERGVYRPGEKIYASIWVRNPELKEMSSVPCLVTVQDPSGNVIYSRKTKTGTAGLIHTDFILPEDAPGGSYNVSCSAADDSCTWGSSSFLSADFVPDRIKVSLKGPQNELSAVNEAADFSFSAEYYFGGKLEKAPYQFTVIPKPAAPRPEWKDWTVGSQEFTPGKKFSRSGKLADQGQKVTYPGFIALGGKAYAPVALNAAAQVSEPGGRAVTANTSLIYHPTPYYLGLQQESENDQAVINWKFFRAEKESLVKQENQKIELKLLRHEWKYILKKSGHKLSREWVQEKVPAGTDTIETGKLQQGSWRKKLPGGRYELIAECGGMRTTLEFWHWYGEGGVRSSNPAVISCTTDKKLYLPGETAKITLNSASDGTVLIALGGRKLAGYKTFPVKKGKNLLAVQIPAGIETSACYAGLTQISGETRQFGLIRFNLDQKRHRLALELAAPEKAMPREKIKVKVSLKTPEGLPQNGMVQLFAVDEGILALTNYKTPDIFDYFYGQYNCDFIFTDIYSLLYPDLKIGRDGKIGGGAGDEDDAAARSRRNAARKATLKSAVAVLPPVQVNGSREFEIALPDHLGAMRLMAVASAADRAGSAQKMLKMRDCLDILPTAPQVCAPGDQVELTFALFNHELKEGKAQFELELPGGKKVQAEPVFKKGKSAVFRTVIQAPAKEGLHSLTATLKKDGIVKKKELKLAVRLPNPAVTYTVMRTLKPGEKWDSGKAPAFAVDSEYSITVSGSSAAVLRNAVDWLNRYPYGCLEQTVSAAFPFLSADALEKCGVISAQMAQTAKVKANISAAKILSMMLYNGAFPMWSGGTTEWTGGTVYAAHFLAAGGNLRNGKQKNLLTGYLKGLLQNASAARYERAYAAYVLALLKNSSKETLSGARNILAGKTDDYASFLAAAALLETGYSGEAYPHLKLLLRKEIWRVDGSAPHFAGPAAKAGMTLYILMKQQTDAPEAIAKLRQTLLRTVRTNGSGWGVTHANAWAVLGLAELERNSAGAKGAAVLSLPGKKTQNVDPARNETIRLTGSAPVTVLNSGNSPIYITYRIKGVPVKAEPVRQVLGVKRSFLRNGKAVSSAKQGDLLTVRIQLDSTAAVKDFVLSDLLPSGLEIEDERFATRSKGAALTNRNQKNLTVKQEEKRPGEFVLSGDLWKRGTVTVTYQARAVSRGKFAMGSTSAEAMYEPETRAFEPGNGFFEVK